MVTSALARSVATGVSVNPRSPLATVGRAIGAAVFSAWLGMFGPATPAAVAQAAGQSGVAVAGTPLPQHSMTVSVAPTPQNPDPTQLTGTRPAHKRPTLGQLDDAVPEERFSPFTGPVLGHHFALGNGVLQPPGRNRQTHPPKWLLDVLPQGNDASGTYQLVTPHEEHKPSTGSLYNPDGTLASKATLRASGCDATLTIVDGTGPFATITARRLSRYDNLGASHFAPVAFEIKQGKKRSHAQLEFTVINRTLVPRRFELSTGDGGRAEISFPHEAEAHVKLQGPRGILDERTLVHGVSLAFVLGTLLATEPRNDIEAARQRGCT
ncbi:MAG: hypothetical protein ACKVPX_14695 [Myxococcaceae bacterium]